MYRVVVGVHSPLGGSGKTTTAFLLSYILACKFGMRVILVDLDIVAPGIPSILEELGVETRISTLDYIFKTTIYGGVDNVEEGRIPTVLCDNMKVIPFTRTRSAKTEYDPRSLLTLLVTHSSHDFIYMARRVITVLMLRETEEWRPDIVVFDLGTGSLPTADVAKTILDTIYPSGSESTLHFFYIMTLRGDPQSMLKASGLADDIRDYVNRLLLSSYWEAQRVYFDYTLVINFLLQHRYCEARLKGNLMPPAEILKTFRGIPVRTPVTPVDVMGGIGALLPFAVDLLEMSIRDVVQFIDKIYDEYGRRLNIENDIIPTPVKIKKFIIDNLGKNGCRSGAFDAMLYFGLEYLLLASYVREIALIGQYSFNS